MRDFYERLVALLGRPENDGAFTQLVAEIGESPDFDRGDQTWRACFFSKLGVHLEADRKRGCWSAVEFHMDTGLVKTLNMNPYRDSLQGGVTPDDLREDVARKLKRLQKLCSDRLSDSYQMPNEMALTFNFDADTDRLSHVCVKYNGPPVHD